MKNKKLFAILTLVCFLMTLMPVAAFADPAPTTDVDNVVAAENCVVEVSEDSDTNVDVKQNVTLNFVARNAELGVVNVEEGAYLYVWATEDDEMTSSLKVKGAEKPYFRNVYRIEAANKINVSFVNAGEYKVNVAYSRDDVKSLDTLRTAMGSPVAVSVSAVDVDTDKYTVELDNDIELAANGVAGDYVATVKYDGKELVNAPVAFESNSTSVTVTAKADKTDYYGKVKISVSATRVGENFKITPVVQGNKLNKQAKSVKVQGLVPTKIETISQAENLIATETGFGKEEIVFGVKDANNNSVPFYSGLFKATLDQPKGSSLTVSNHVQTEKTAPNVKEDLYLEFDGYNAKLVAKDGNFKKEGKYTLTAVLYNGATAKATWEVKKPGKVVRMEVVPDENYVAPVKGNSFDFNYKYYDANGIEINAADKNDDIDFYVLGDAVKRVVNRTVFVNAGDKFVGQEIVINAENKTRELKATATVKVTNDAYAVEFEDVALDTYRTNNVDWYLVNANGEKEVCKDVNINKEKSFVKVLKAPEGALAEAFLNKDNTVSIACDKVGTVTVQLVVKYAGKYYTTEKVFAVGGATVGDVVVMTIGTQTLVKNGKVTTMDATPIIKDNRTFVPFRALAEAFGAKVNYNEADKTVTAELDGAKVVMTIGSNAYTVNGVAKTMDVAPYIDGSRTMVPVRFVAEAFGIDVTAVPDVTDGTTASVIFNK